MMSLYISVNQSSNVDDDMNSFWMARPDFSQAEKISKIVCGRSIIFILNARWCKVHVLDFDIHQCQRWLGKASAR